jgi:antitoxin component YwqK of YwqJK toxin-antitoxin module
MLSRNILMLLMLFLLISCKKSGNTKEIYNEGENKVEGKFLNGRREGLHKYYDVSGNLVMIKSFVNDTLEGKMVQFWPDSSKTFSRFKRGKLLSNITIAEDGDTICIIKNHKSQSFSKEGLLEKIIIYGKTRKDDRKITFDSVGHLVELTKPLNFLDKKDTIYLDKSYPNWKEQVREWERK